MNVWLLQYWCSDSNGYDFEKLFFNIDNAVDYVNETYPNDEGYTLEENADGNVSLFRSQHYKGQDDYNGNPDWIITLEKVI